MRSYLVMRSFPWQMFLDFLKQAGKVQIHVFYFYKLVLKEVIKFYHFCRDRLGIAEYSLSQSTLETIFNHFAANSWSQSTLETIFNHFAANHMRCPYFIIFFHKKMHGGCIVLGVYQNYNILLTSTSKIQRRALGEILRSWILECQLL